ncbi:MAG: sulfatase [Haliea sp.]|nr:sulfatase [Haliea sp.]
MFRWFAYTTSVMLVTMGVFLATACDGGSSSDSSALTQGNNISEVQPAADALNVLLIVADDLGPQLGVYGDSQAQTPNIDQLAAAGVLFEQAYVTQASCSSSRSSILSGLYPMQNGQLGLAASLPEYQLKPGIETMPSLLHGAGYFTGILGKLHVGPDEPFPFDYEWARSNNAMASRDVGEVARLADEFLGKAGNSPFFLYVNLFDPHRPFDDSANQLLGLPPQPRSREEIEPFPYLGLDGPLIREEVAIYYNAVSRLDAGVGMLLDVLSARGVRDNTVIIFLGDHGPPFTRAKGTSYEAGVRIPLIISWPEVGTPSSRSRALVSTVDLLPTVLDAVKLKSAPMAGASLREVMRGNLPGDWRRWLFTEYTSHAKEHFYPRRSVRGDRFKLIHNLDAGRRNPLPYEGRTRPGNALVVSEGAARAYQTQEFPPALELYDLQLDPYEMRNLADDPAYLGIREELHRTLQQWRESMGDPLLDPAELRRLRSVHGINTP